MHEDVVGAAPVCRRVEDTAVGVHLQEEGAASSTDAHVNPDRGAHSKQEGGMELMGIAENSDSRRTEG